MAGGPAEPPLVDCALAGTVAVTISWDDANRQPEAFYGTAQALTLGDNVVYYQNLDHGWPKNIDMTTTATAKAPSTIDNDGTTTQIELLGRIYSATRCPKYWQAFQNGVQYLLASQYDNGGFPQYYPNPDGYRAHITFNDGAMVHVLSLLREISNKMPPYTFVDDDLAARSGQSVSAGIDCILKSQVVHEGKKTGWCAQHDEVTLAPAQARSYELPSLSGSEGAGLLEFLMTIEDPSPEVREAVEGAVAWFQQVTLTGIRVESVAAPAEASGKDTVVVADASAPPIWARFYELGTNMPIFSSRCEVPECEADPFFLRRYSLAEIENERRVGYSWYGDWPADVLNLEYPAWKARWGF